MIYSFNTYTPTFTDSNGNKLKNSISSMEKIEIGNSPQWVFIRGKDISKPILLFLHGGPGTTATAHIRRFIPELEEKFVVIHWDQRGAGKSYSAGSQKEMLTKEQLIIDTGELTKKILDRFHRQKMYIMGVSWGTYLGIEAIKRWPEFYHAYIGVGQIVDQDEGEKISYNFVMSNAKENNNEDAIQTLEKIGVPPYPVNKHVKYLMKQRKLLDFYGGSFKNRTIQKQFSQISIILKQSEYNLIDKINWVRGQMRSEKVLGPDFRKVNFLQTSDSLNVPVFFLQGKHDKQTPTELVEKYFKILKAPHKELHIFKQSAHLPIIEETSKFLDVLDDIILLRASL